MDEPTFILGVSGEFFIIISFYHKIHVSKQFSSNIIWNFIVSSPEPKAQRWAYRKGGRGVRPSVHTFIHIYLLDRNRGPTATKFYLKHHLGRGKYALGSGLDRIRILVSLASHSSHMLIMGKNGVLRFSQAFLIRSFSYLQLTMTYIRAWMSSNFNEIRAWTTELSALDNLIQIP